MKKISLVLITLLAVIGLVACIGNSKEQKAIISYINEDNVELAEIEEKLLASYGSVTGDNYVNDEIMYTELTTKTLGLVKDLNAKAVELSDSIRNPEVLEVHKIYMNYSSKFLSTINIMIEALEKQDSSLINEANETLNEANNFALDYRTELYKLADKYNVEIIDK